MNESPTIRRLMERPFGAAQDPSKPVRRFDPPPAATGGGTTMPSTTTTAPAPGIPRPARTLGDTHTWTPTLNSGTDRTGAPVYDAASIRRLEARNSGGLQARPDFSNVTTGAPAVPRPTRTLDPAGSASARLETDYTRPAPPDPAPQVQQSVRHTLNGPGAMAEQYNSREDREFARKLSSDIDSQLFALSLPAGRRGREGRQATQAMSALRGQQASLAGGMAAQTGQQIDRRLTTDAQLANTQTQEQGAMQRTLVQDATQREGQQLGFQRSMAEIQRPTLQTDADGNLLQVTGTTAAPITGADGVQVRMPQRPVTARDHQAEADDKLLAELLGIQKDSYGEYVPNALENARRQLAEIRGGQRGGGVQVPEVGGTLDGYRFRGGDPSDPANWEAQ